MPKVNNYLVPKWIKSYQELKLQNDGLFCAACSKIIICERKSQVDQHVKTSLHQAKVKKLRETKLTQISLSTAFAADANPGEREIFNRDLCDALISANIPLNKLNNEKFKCFLEKYCNKTIPNESTLRKRYVDVLYVDVIAQIKERIGDDYIYFIVDETTDVNGRYIANLLVGSLNEEKVAKSYLICSKQLEKTNNLTIARFVNESLMEFYSPEKIPTNKILLMVSDAASYMNKAAQQLKIFYENLIHVTCLAHGLNRVAEEIRKEFPTVNSLINNVKKIFIKAPLRLQMYREKLPHLPLPPQPVITRWGTWLEAAIFYATNFQSIKEFILDLPDSAESIKESKDLINNGELISNLSFIKGHYGFLSIAITQLETREMPLTESLSIINNCVSLINKVPGNVGKLISKKLKDVLEKNEGYAILKSVGKTMTLEKNENDQYCVKLGPEKTIALKNAPITSVDVERSFSAYKNILSDRRQRFTCSNLEKHLIISCFAQNN